MATRKQLVLRVQPDSNSAIRRAAKQQGLSINAWSEGVLARAAGLSKKSKPAAKK